MITTLEAVERVPCRSRGDRAGRKAWSIAIPIVVVLAIEALIPGLPHPSVHDVGNFVESVADHGLMDGSWGWFGSS